MRLGGLHLLGGGKALHQEKQDIVIDRIDLPPDGVEGCIRAVKGHRSAGSLLSGGEAAEARYS